jgi:hypothetical protein
MPSDQSVKRLKSEPDLQMLLGLGLQMLLGLGLQMLLGLGLQMLLGLGLQMLLGLITKTSFYQTLYT